MKHYLEMSETLRMIIRLEEDDVRLAQSLEKLIRMAKSKEGAQSGII